MILQDNLKLTGHIDHLTSACSSSFYAISKLKAHGLSPPLIQSITIATTMSKLLYASPSWWWLALASDKERLEKILKRAKRLHFIEQSYPTVSELANTADTKLFLFILHNPNHVLYQFLPPLRPPTNYNMRERIHNHMLPHKNNSQFISRALYKNIY